MQQKNSKISVANDANKPSYFMVDLSSKIAEQEAQREEDDSTMMSTLKARFNSKEEEGLIEELEEAYKSTSEDDAEDMEKLYNYETKELQIGDFAFIQAIKAFFIFIKSSIVFIVNMFNKTGYAIVFSIRFVYLFVFAILKRLFVLSKNIPQAVFKKSRRANIWQENYQLNEEFAYYNLKDPKTLAALTEEDSQVPFVVKETPLLEAETVVEAVHKNYEQTLQNQEADYFREDVFKKEKIQRPKIKMPEINYLQLKKIFVFASIAIVLVVPFKALTYYGVLQDFGGRVLGVSEDAINDIRNAGNSAGSMDFYEAGEQFAEASDNFLKAQSEMEAVNGYLKFLGSIIPSQKLKLAADAEYVLEAGRISSKIGQQISYMLDTLSFMDDKSIKNVYNLFYDNVEVLHISTLELHSVLLNIDASNLPDEHIDSFITLRDKTLQVSNSFLELSDLLEKLKIFLGFESDKRYLLIFQNNSEMRASGGFMGSYSVVDFRDGEIVNIETPKGGTYDTEAGYNERIIAPRPLHIVNPLWHFWDANWWPDWKKTSKKLKWFYEKSGGSSVDGVIGITPVVAERLLEAIGPLDMQDTHGVTINAENFWNITQTFAEQKPKNHPAYEPLPYSSEDASSTSNNIDGGMEPKKIIGDLIAEITEELPKRLDKDMFFSLLTGLEQSLAEKHVLFYFDDYILQNKFENLGWAGRTKETNWDYLMVVNSNISGFKSDRMIEQEINHQSEILEDGSIINTVKILRTHTGEKGERFTGVKNLNWMRVYLPLGSEFIEASGFWPPDESLFEKPDPSWTHDPDLKNSEENFIRDSLSWTKIYQEDSKTVFANWVQVDPGETVEIVIKYILPFKIHPASDESQAKPYALLIEKQPGAKDDFVSSRLIVPDSINSNWHYPETIEADSSGWFIESDLRVDRFWAITLY